jgi:phosphate/sulfate permease
MARPRNITINSRTVVAPLAAFTMACLLFVYTRTSIQAAKKNAQAHREADGGQINWQNENLRRHGMLHRPGNSGDIAELAEKAKDQVKAAEEDLIKAKGKRRE